MPCVSSMMLFNTRKSQSIFQIEVDALIVF